VSWSVSNTGTSMKSVAMSASGQYCVTADSGYFWRSTNYGATWSSISFHYGGVEAYGACISASGQYAYACTTATQTAAYSSNFGASYTAKSSVYGADTVIATDATGQYVVVAGEYSYGRISSSSNYGVTWTQRLSNGADYDRVEMSKDGKYSMALSMYDVDYVRRSTNYGASYSSSNIMGNVKYGGCAYSWDGEHQFIAPASGQIYVSNNYGSTWAAKGTSAAFKNIATNEILI
jgi:photosystem II stability/assembly factor-like uncharacterized protein